MFGFSGGPFPAVALNEELYCLSYRRGMMLKSSSLSTLKDWVL
jgi:hypothetical protein